jgi:GT2 family glycosyltransferase
MSATKRVLVSVLNFNVVDDTITTLKCLERQTYGGYDLELVDNASTNDAVTRIRAAMPHITVIRNDVNSGYSGGMNTILKRGLAAGYDFVVVCNNDIEVEPEAIAQLVAAANAHEDAGLVGGVDVDYFNGKVRAVGGTRFSLWRLRIDWSADVSGDASSEREYVQGAIILFTRKALTVGVTMDENLFMYYEEADVGFQLRRHGLRSYVANAFHFHHKANRRFLDVRGGYYQQRNRVYMVRKYGKFYHLWWHIAYAVLFELPAKIVLRSAQGHGGYALACVTGFRDGVLGRTGKWEGR